MARIERIEDVPDMLLAYLAGRWVAIAQIECNAGSGRQHTVELHAQAAAAVWFLGTRASTPAIADMAGAVDALGQMIRTSYPERTETTAQFPPSPMVVAEVVRAARVLADA